MTATYNLGNPVQTEDGSLAQLVISRTPYHVPNRYGRGEELVARSEFVYVETGEKLPYGIGVRVPGTRRWLTPDSLPEVSFFEDHDAPKVSSSVTFRGPNYTLVFADETRAGKAWEETVRADLKQLQIDAPDLFTRMATEEITRQHKANLLHSPSYALTSDALDKVRAVKSAGGDYPATVEAFTDALRDELLNMR